MKSHHDKHHHHKPHSEKAPKISIFINTPVVIENKVENKNEQKSDEGCASCFDWLKKRF